MTLRRTGYLNQRQRPGVIAAADREVLIASPAFAHDAGDGFIVGRPARVPAGTGGPQSAAPALSRP